MLNQIIADMRAAQTFLDNHPTYHHGRYHLGNMYSKEEYAVCSLGAAVLSKEPKRHPLLIGYGDVHSLMKWSLDQFNFHGNAMRGEQLIYGLNDGDITGKQMTPGEIADYLEENRVLITELERGTNCSRELLGAH